MKIANTPAKKFRKQKPELKWQTGNFERTQTFRYNLPYAFLLLCKLWGVKPDDILLDFMNNLSCNSRQSKGKDDARDHLKNYIVAMGYGTQHYTIEDIEQMFATLTAIGSLWPETAKTKMIERHARWRNKYYNWWFKKTWGKYKRKPLQ